MSRARPGNRSEIALPRLTREDSEALRASAAKELGNEAVRLSTYNTGPGKVRGTRYLDRRLPGADNAKLSRPHLSTAERASVNGSCNPNGSKVAKFLDI